MIYHTSDIFREELNKQYPGGKAPTKHLKLFHGTTPDAAAQIAKTGFKPGEDRCIWLTTSFDDAMNYDSGGLVVVDASSYALNEMGCKFFPDRPGDQSNGRVVCCKWEPELTGDVKSFMKTAETDFIGRKPNIYPEQLGRAISTLQDDIRDDEAGKTAAEYSRKQQEYKRSH